jgi:serine/threonine protein kinase
VNGGEIFTYISKEKRFHEKRVRQYAAEMVHAIGYLHFNSIIYRDLKPENVLLDTDGHIKIIDFGLAKTKMKAGQRTFSFCGTPEYMAPEIASSTGHSFSSDWYNLGTLVYEMLAGQPPHWNADKFIMMQNRINSQPTMKSNFSQEAKSFLTGILDVDPKKRLKEWEIKKHPFFYGIDWD